MGMFDYLKSDHLALPAFHFPEHRRPKSHGSWLYVRSKLQSLEPAISPPAVSLPSSHEYPLDVSASNRHVPTT